MRTKITETVLRDAHQSLLSTRMKTEDMLPIAPIMDEIGYWSVEMWGGATFDSCLRFLKEDPWERVSKLKALMPNTPFQMLLRGQNIVGYRHYSDDIVEKFVARAATRGIDVFRIFDALNDVRNMQTAMRAAKKAGGIVEATIAYTISPVHNIPSFIKTAIKLKELGADTICIKDMAGLLSPYNAYELVKGLREETALPVHLHTHATSGMATAMYVKGVEAGAEIIDTAISSMAMGTSQPPTESLVACFKDTEFDTGLDLRRLKEIADYFKEVRKKYHMFEAESNAIDTNVLIFQIPGGMTSNFATQLREAKQEGKMTQVLEEVPRVRAELGYPPLVTPTSQIVGTQAALNVISGERYKMVTKETRDLVRGLYGRTPAEIDPAIRKKIIGDDVPITMRPADLLEPEYERLAQEAGPLARGEEDVLSYALFPQVALEYFRDREMNDKGLNLKDIAAIAVLYMRSMEKRPDVKSNGTSMDLWRAAARRESMSQGGWMN